jgi:hypothetical protein
MASRKNRRTLKKQGKKSRGGSDLSSTQNLSTGQNTSESVVQKSVEPQGRQQERTWGSYFSSLFKTGGKTRSRTNKRRR